MTEPDDQCNSAGPGALLAMRSEATSRPEGMPTYIPPATCTDSPMRSRKSFSVASATR